MAIAPQILSQLRPVGGGASADYTVGGGENVTVSSILMHNTDASTTDTAQVNIGNATAVESVTNQAWNINVPPEGTIIITAGFTLSATDVVMTNSTNGTVSFQLFGIVET